MKILFPIYLWGVFPNPKYQWYMIWKETQRLGLLGSCSEFQIIDCLCLRKTRQIQEIIMPYTKLVIDQLNIEKRHISATATFWFDSTQVVWNVSLRLAIIIQYFLQLINFYIY